MPNILRTFSLQSNTVENHYLMPVIFRPSKHPQYWKVTAWAQEHWLLNTVCLCVHMVADTKGVISQKALLKYVESSSCIYLDSTTWPGPFCVCVGSLSRYSDVLKQSQHTHLVVLGYLENLNRHECECRSFNNHQDSFQESLHGNYGKKLKLIKADK